MIDGRDERGRGPRPTDRRQASLDRARSVKDLHAERLKAYPNVVGVGVGREIVGGKSTDRVCVRVYVSKKLPERDLPPGGVLPDTIDEVPVDVIEDEFWIHPAPVSIADHRRLQNFLVGGISVGNLMVGGSGTLGVSVFDNRTGQEMFLSNWHVLCGRDACEVGEVIIQPGQGGGDTGTAQDSVARLLRWRLDASVDAAIAQPSGERILFKEVLEIGLVEASTRATLGMLVLKSGRTSGLTVGTVSDVSANLDVNGYPGGKRHFVDQIVMEADGEISQPGDSGSIWVDEAKQVVGLNFAGSRRRAIANHIDAVFAALDINVGPGMTVLDWQARAALL